MPEYSIICITLARIMLKAIEQAQRKLVRSSQLLDYRRLNWRVETNHRIRWAFEAFMREARQSGFPFQFHLCQHNTPNEGVIQMTAGGTLTGVVNRKYDKCELGFSDETCVDTPVVETGGELVATLSCNGFVHFIAHPRTSDRLKAIKPDLILLGPLDPADVTVHVIRKALRRFLLVLQNSSTIGAADALTVRERVWVVWFYFRDMRSRYDLYRSLLSMKNEWGKLLVTGVITFLIGYVTAIKT